MVPLDHMKDFAIKCPNSLQFIRENLTFQDNQISKALTWIVQSFFYIFALLNMPSDTIEHAFFHNFILTRLTVAMFVSFVSQLFAKTILFTKQITGQ